MKTLRIGLFTDTYFPDRNGVTTSVYLLQQELRRAGHDAWIIAPSHPDAPETEDGVVRFRSVSNPLVRGTQTRLALPRARRLPAGLDIVHAHTPFVIGAWAGRVAHRLHVPHVATFHTDLERYAHYVPGGAYLNTQFHLARRMCRRFYRRSDLIVTPTPAVAVMVDAYNTGRPVRVVPTGIDPDVLNRAPDVPSPWPAGTRRLLTVSRLGAEKKLSVVLRALADVRRTHAAHLVIIGEGPLESALNAEVQALGLSGHVTFHGAVPYQQIGAYYRQAELFCFASDTETQGLVLAEAQMMGVPVVAVGAGGTMQGVAHGRSGYLVTPGDHAGLAAFAGALLDDPDRHAQFTTGARQFAAHFSAAQVTQGMLRVYAEALDLARHDPPGSSSMLLRRTVQHTHERM